MQENMNPNDTIYAFFNTYHNNEDDAGIAAFDTERHELICIFPSSKRVHLYLQMKSMGTCLYC